ncbi:zinc finger CCHC domain-containing protein 2 [Biomphalaria pfeifferi]|uniref:Zinc finger CCHC domain-containing protein 2 n=1 Tax=Biomphalaria pfeifferi TaxID=112525 RepID=A0AAD8FFY1_BIOPF|nr:zinc finger CCHC domain-containing protein 2 [Biomphalaria pfeifferi]
MVRKEDLCEWFKNLRPCKRLDYMCGLLHMCLPTELRFIGTVIEDLAKKDYHSLRDAEIKANQQAELSTLASNVLSDYRLRTKIIMALALLNSTNSSCAKIIFDILEKQCQIDEQISNIIINEQIFDEILLILTMAVHHPAFKISQKLKLGEILEKVERLVKERNIHSNINGGMEEPDLILPSQSEPTSSHAVSHSDSQSSGADSQKKVSVVSIEIIDYKDLPYNKKNEKSIKGYQIHSNWSNGEIREVFMKPKALHDLHLKFVGQLPDEKKRRKHIPFFPARGKDESAEKHKETYNEYLSKMAKVLTQFPDCDVFTEPFRSGTLVNRPPVLSDRPRSVQSVEFMRHNSLRLSNSSSPVQSSPGPSQMSSSTTSPANSRTSSPTSPLPSAHNRHLMNVKGSSVGTHLMGHAQTFGPSHIELSLYQLLVLLNLEKYFENLKEFSVKQVMFMSPEDFIKSGLPAEAHERLRKKLEKLKLTLYSNGISDPLGRVPSAESTPTYLSFYPFMSQTYSQFSHPPEFSQFGTVIQPPLPPPPVQPSAGSSSPINNDISSPPSSPLPSADQAAPHHVVQNSLLPVMSPPSAVVSAIADIKTKQAWSHVVDASGSEDDRVSNLMVTNKVKGRGRPQHSQSLPQISQSTQSVEESKMSTMSNSVSVPHTHPALINVEPRTDAHPFLVPLSIVNGYASDPPPQPLQGPPPTLARNYYRPSYKTPQPTHTGQKNLIPMPVTYDMQQSSQGSGKSNGIHIQHFMPASANPSNQILLQNPSNNTLPLGSQPPPPSLPEGYHQLYYFPGSRMVNPSSINTPQGLLSGAPLSHVPAPLAPNTSPEQTTSVLTNTDMVESNRSDGALLNPPSHTPPHHNLTKSQNNASGPDSGTPSPPLGPVPPKQPEPPAPGRSVIIYNGLVAPYIFPQQSLPNGIPHDMLWPIRYGNPLLPNHIPFMYGNTIFPNHGPTITQTANSNSTPQVVVPNPVPAEPAPVIAGKSICYNCGQAGHDPSKCEENTMENMSKTYRLNYKPKSDSE